VRVAIVGAGISGLACAFYLQQARPDWQLTVFDRRQRPGGTMATVNVDGFLFEAGANGFLTNKPDGLDLVHASGAGALLLPSSDLARKRFIYADKLHRLPESPAQFLNSRLLTLPQKLRVAGELLVPRRRDEVDETLQEFGYRRLGEGFTDVLLDAMVAGIYATTPDRVSVGAAFPQVTALEQEYGGLLRGMLAKRRAHAGPGGTLVSFRGGVGAFVDHLRATIDADWRLGERIVALRRDHAGWHLETARGHSLADRVIVSAPAHAASAMLAATDAELSARLGAIEYTPIAVVGFGYRALAHPLDGFGLLTTSSVGLPILGVLWDSSIFAARAPADGKCVRVLIGGQRNPGLVNQDDPALIATAREGLRTTMGIDESPDAVFVKRWPQGIPSYARGHTARVAAVFERLARFPGLYLNCNAYHGIAMNDCARNGRELAARIAAASGMAE
jgi:oxygen-dependent protoporphyrinogen oxidase